MPELPSTDESPRPLPSYAVILVGVLLLGWAWFGLYAPSHARTADDDFSVPGLDVVSLTCSGVLRSDDIEVEVDGAEGFLPVTDDSGPEPEVLLSSEEAGLVCAERRDRALGRSLERGGIGAGLLWLAGWLRCRPARPRPLDLPSNPEGPRGVYR